MSKLSPIGVRKLEQIVKRMGFECVRQKGSHAFYEHPDGRTTVIAIHYGEDIGKGLLKKIVNEDLKMTMEEFDKLR